MSAQAESKLLEAVRDRIRSQTSLRDAQVEMEYDELPPAGADDVFVAVMPGTVLRGDPEYGGHAVISKRYGVEVAIIFKIGRRPRDRRRNLYQSNADSVNAVAELIEDVIDANYDLLTVANTALSAAVGEGFIEPLTFAGYSPLRTVGAEYFTDSGDAAHGLVRKISFAGAHYLEVRT